jgi:hypothetical protein
MKNETLLLHRVCSTLTSPPAGQFQKQKSHPADMLGAVMLALCPSISQGSRLFMKMMSQFNSRALHLSAVLPSAAIRCARPIDIAHIDACNRATLPENYNREFYEEQIQKWPELALVAINDKNELVQ